MPRYLKEVVHLTQAQYDAMVAAGTLDPNTMYVTPESEAEDAEAWAKGTRGGVPVTEGQDGYHDNSKYYSEQAADAAAAAAQALIDDTAGEGDTDKVWSADKSADEVSDLEDAIAAKYTKPASGIPATDLAEGVIPDVPVEKGTGTGSAQTKQFTQFSNTYTQTASGTAAFAEGRGTTASGNYSHAEGDQTTASGISSHAENSGTAAEGKYSHAEGLYTVAKGNSEHVAGNYNKKSTVYPEWVASTSYAVGDKVSKGGNGYECKTANSDATWNLSHWNALTFNTDHVFVIGNGKGQADQYRSNAAAIDWNGDARFAGDVYVGANADSSGGSKLPRIDDTAGTGDTGKVWSADKSASENSSLSAQISLIQEMIADAESSATAAHAHSAKTVFIYDRKLLMALSAIAVGDTITTTGANPNAAEVTLAESFPHDVQVNGISVVSSGVADVPVADSSNLGVVKLNSSYGIWKTNNNELKINSADSDSIKNGSNTSSYAPVSRQHISTYYGLSKLAGVDLKNETVTVGTYTEDAKAAIQKMLGIYEAPWELIREDTFTNATEANHEITVDGNGNAFELTDVYLEFLLPEQSTEATVGSYGRIDSYYDSSRFFSSYHGAKTQAANGYSNGTFLYIKNDKGAVYRVNGNYNTMGTDRVATCVQGKVSENRSLLVIGNYVFVKFKILSVKGTGSYRLYGKRKWT